MAIRVALNHKTGYHYDRPVELSPQIVRLRPAPHTRTPIVSYSLTITPKHHFLNWQQDPQGNYIARVIFPDRVRAFEVEVDLIAELTAINPFDFFVEASAEEYPFEYEAWLAEELAPFLKVENRGAALDAWLGDVDRAKRKTMDFLVELNARLQRDLKYVVRLEPGIQSCEETLTLRSGSCRDSAWLLVQILRNLGLAARFVSGYLVQLVADQKSLDGPSGPEADFTDLHAWTEVYLPGAGWVGLDPTSGLLAAEGHIPVACTPDPASAAPISGAVEPCTSTFDFSMSIARVQEDPRVTLPYSDAQWNQIVALGRDVDRRLQAGDVRLTMGGEPTFVSVDDVDGDEWRTAAVGPTKRRIAGELLGRLRDRFAPGALVHWGQGKWYPGESLPRWALGCYWRTDGEPVWSRHELLADPHVASTYTIDDARRLVETLARGLEVATDHIALTYEDTAYYLWREQRLPLNIDPRDPKLEDEEERRRLARVFETKLTTPVGCVLPLERQWWQAKARWRSGSWPVRSDQLFLVPGDSPMGLRLPLDSLPWQASAEQLSGTFPRDPMARRPRLPAYAQLHQRPSATAQGADRADERGVDAAVGGAPRSSSEDVVRTALCIEPRDGRLHVFMPPLDILEDYLDLLAAVEEAAAALALPVIIEGYAPPDDPRLKKLAVTPDPGVLEVNIHPAGDWDELVAITNGVYADARQSRLSTERFDRDGSHTGTGGGNHVVLGGPTPTESPFLRRPDLLRSLVGYWHNHPALSYLFSGAFIGPTSQAPRVDESRRDAVYELGIAFEQIPTHGEVPPWLVDRVFRHLLVDGTGNTHRAEFCIDKLFSPDSSSGRLGLVEFRAFEMPPHPRMSLTQQLLLRALVARFWDTPYENTLVDWGTTLHDRFMLPHFVWRDCHDVIDDTRRAGIALDPVWFIPHFEFRFPRIGEIEQDGVRLELRRAIEPWYVLGEEPAGGFTARYVDSSVERIQVKVSGMVDTRHVVTCNGRKVPLHPTGTEGEFVAGVRYRAWQPPSCLHPTIPVDEPLVFDLLDTWLLRSVGGCRYHTGHPGGLNPEAFPVNALEAEGRRASRFFKTGHTGGSMVNPRDEPNSTYPLTLDLRRGRRSAGDDAMAYGVPTIE